MSRGPGGEHAVKLIFDLHTVGPVQVAKNARFWQIHLPGFDNPAAVGDFGAHIPRS